jgi:hypothetical protein
MILFSAGEKSPMSRWQKSCNEKTLAANSVTGKPITEKLSMGKPITEKRRRENRHQ